MADNVINVGKKVNIPLIITLVVIFLAIIVLFSSFYTVNEDEYGIIRQFGKVNSIKDEAGLYFKIPFIEEISYLPRNKHVYDVPSSEVLTNDKKALVVDNYVVWQIVDPLKFIQSVSTVYEMERRLDAAVYSVVKNTMGTLEQSSIIQAGNDTDKGNRNNVNKEITDKVNLQISNEYGVEVHSVEIKKLDLPADNEAAVYNRMISDREQIAATFIAEGLLEASKIHNETDKNAVILISNAQARAEQLIGEGEAEYMRILASAYNTPDKMDFYEFYRSLEATKNSMTGKKVLILPSDSYIAKIFLNN